ncbi:MAG: T9SS type A sorting domain-containing protein, partial [Candidatus Lokiarchaeota archaeon]|nr:T9SS type A sorting domain-containing protein [Candidatus Lokiarchaeota archaeon]
DNAGNRAELPKSKNYLSISVESQNEIPLDTLGYPIYLTNGENQSDYQLFSIPLILENASPDCVLIDDLGDNLCGQNWRFFEHKEANDYIEFPNTANFFPGKAFWLITKTRTKLIDTGPCRSLFLTDTSKVLAEDTSTFKNISLSDDWNLIGTPFNFPIPFDRLQLANGWDLEDRIITFDSTWVGLSADSSFEPWTGYAIKTGEITELIVNPDVYLENSGYLEKVSTYPLCEIQIEANVGKTKDIYTGFGIHSEASPEWDSYDRFEPPPMGENYLMTYFNNKKWTTHPDIYAYDFQPLNKNYNEWTLESRTNIADLPISLKFIGINSIPDSLDIYLQDKKLNAVQNLKTNNYYKYTTRDGNEIRTFKLIIGKNDYLTQNKSDLFKPRDYILYQNYPNPFNQSTTIRFALPRESIVNLTIYNMLGKQIKKLINNKRMSMGTHSVIWNGSDDNHSLISSGIYLCLLDVEGDLSRIKTVLMK